jgi:hypothetical protein
MALALASEDARFDNSAALAMPSLARSWAARGR